MTTSRDARVDLALDSLHGLSVGDALGARFFVPGESVSDLVAGRPPAPPWQWTDDTEMACSVFRELCDNGGIDQDRLAAAFADRCEPYRGYGPGAVVILHEIRDGRLWAEAAAAAFGGTGSCGNGAAMRVAPLGAYFAGDVASAVEQAARSAEVTHAHPEGIAGAVAVAAATAIAAGLRRADGPSASGDFFVPKEFLAAVAGTIEDGPTRTGILRARDLAARAAVGGVGTAADGAGTAGGDCVAEAAYELGNGSRATSQDSVPFALWAASVHLADYPAAITACVRAGGDVDTTAAMAGGIVAAFTGIEGQLANGHGIERQRPDGIGPGRDGQRPDVRGIPRGWLAAREFLPHWSTRT